MPIDTVRDFIAYLTEMEVNKNTDISNEAIMFSIRYNEECFRAEVFELFKTLRERIKYRLSWLSSIDLKFFLIGKSNTISCSNSHIGVIQNGMLIFPTSYIFPNCLSVKCCGNSCVILTNDYKLFKISLYNMEEIEGQFIKYECSSDGNIFAIKRSGVLYSSNDMFYPIGFCKDIYLRNGILSILKENGDVNFIEYKNGKITFEIIGRDVKKCISNGDFYCILLQNGNIEVYNIMKEKTAEMEGPFIDIDCADTYLLAIKENRELIFWHDINADDLPIDNLTLLENESKNVHSVYCQDSFYFILYQDKTAKGKGTKNNVLINNVRGLATSEKRCIIFNEEENILEI